MITNKQIDLTEIIDKMFHIHALRKRSCQIKILGHGNPPSCCRFFFFSIGSILIEYHSLLSFYFFVNIILSSWSRGRYDLQRQIQNSCLKQAHISI